MSKLVIIGGGGAGMTAALTAKKINPKAKVAIISNQTQSYSPCALPFVIGGEIPELDDITTPMDVLCKKSGIEFILDSAVSIDPKEKKVLTAGKSEVSYDSLIIATGGSATSPPIPGVDLENIFPLYTTEDAERIMEKMKSSREAVVIGGGAIGLEAAVAFAEKGLKTTLVEGFDHVLFRFFDAEILKVIESYLSEHGVDLVLGNFVEELVGDKMVSGVKVAGNVIPADFVIMAAGVRANSEIAETAGIEMERGVILVDWLMETSVKDIYAAGDCAYSRSMLTGDLMLSQLGTTAVRHGTIAGMNAVGESVAFEGALGSMALKLFDLQIGRTGLTEKEAKEKGFDPVSGRAKATTRAKYYPGHEEVDVKLIFDLPSKQLIGGQIVGGGAVSKKIDLIALGIAKKADVEDIIELGYSYTPPLAPSHNAIVLAAENAYRKIKRLEQMRKKKLS